MAQAAGDVETNMWMFAAKLRQQRGRRGGKIFGHAETHYAVAPLIAQSVVRFAVECDDPAGIAEQPFALFGELDLMRCAFQ